MRHVTAAPTSAAACSSVTMPMTSNNQQVDGADAPVGVVRGVDVVSRSPVGVVGAPLLYAAPRGDHHRHGRGRVPRLEPHTTVFIVESS
jgi:hypothetical protein